MRPKRTPPEILGFVTLITTPLTFSIATYLSLGVIPHTVVKMTARKHREIGVPLWLLTILFVVRHVYLTAE